MRNIDTVLFDLDGTLVDSNELIIKSFYETMKKYLPNREFSRKELIEMIGPPLKETFLVASSDPKVILEMINYYRKVYVDLEFDYIELYPNVIETLKKLADNGVQLGIVTTKFKESAMPSIKHYGLDKYITSYCFLDNVTEHKPHPEPIFYALKQFKNYKNVLMVGDNSSDILAGKNASALTCGVAWSIKKDLIKGLNPDYWIMDYLDLLDIVLKKEK
ncbi:HAD-IA family hydrolase [Candidatus Izemoplasma sp. B36]|uniref:HAD-IA family hydrolase n=1 Tax=Candidatus Izemoplasma sp. B36 TaxID=3242468 RepID=UPI0035585EF5